MGGLALRPYRIFRGFRGNGTFLGSAKCNGKWHFFGEARQPLCSPKNYHERSEYFAKNFRKFSDKIAQLLSLLSLTSKFSAIVLSPEFRSTHFTVLSV
jgi:hypothetical protein